jgi:radical SAM protein with 4Fe4S-binding SPASM domain
MLIGPAFVPEVSVSPLIEKAGQDYIVLHPDRPCFLLFNRVGYAAFRQCDGKKTVREIASALSETFDAAPPAIEADLIGFFKRIRETWLMAAGQAAPAAPAVDIRKLHLNVTHDCNLRCLHCALEGGDRTGRLETAEIRAILRDFQAMGGGHIAVSGGEPLLIEEIPDLCIEAAAHFSVSLSTNGLLMTPGLFERLDRHKIAVHLSMDGAGPEVHDTLRGEGAFSGLKGILARMGAADPEVPHGVYTTLTKRNIGDVRRIIGLCRQYGVRRIHFMPLQKMGRAAAHWDRLAPSPAEMLAAYRFLYLESDEVREAGFLLKGGFQGLVLDFAGEARWCGLGKVLAVDADGGVYPCSLMTVPGFLLGNIRETSLEEISRSGRLESLVGECACREKQIAACRSCGWRNFCQGGCPASNFYLRGSLYETDDLCEARKTLFPALIRKRLSDSHA